MIFPGNIFEKSSLNLLHIKVAGTLVLLNIIIYLAVALPQDIEEFKSPQLGLLNQKSYQDSLNDMYLQTKDALDQKNQGSTLFLKDMVFWNQIETYPFKGDHVQIEKNKKVIRELKNFYEKSSQKQYGLSEEPTTPWVWLTYQFMHASFFHLMSNMLFLYLTCQILQMFISTEWILATYILGGIGAGIGYLFFDQGGQVAMVGASGSISALMAFLALVKNIENVPWSFVYSFHRKGFGVLYMPAFLIFPMYLMADFTYLLLQSSSTQSGVAYSAHVGGSLTGIALGAVYLLDQKIRHHILKEWGSSLNQREIDTLRQKDIAEVSD